VRAEAEEKAFNIETDSGVWDEMRLRWDEAEEKAFNIETHCVTRGVWDEAEEKSLNIETVCITCGCEMRLKTSF
jgi:hypothetical protein